MERQLLEKKPSPEKVVPKHPTVKLFAKPGSSEQREFLLMQDKEIGFGSDRRFEDYITEMQKDDDVDTDEEVYDTALKACSRDFNEARLKLESLSLNTFVNNCEIKKRVSQPELYDRNGKFCAFTQGGS